MRQLLTSLLAKGKQCCYKVMSIKGYFPTGIIRLPAPHVQAVVFLPRLNINGLASFMIDTGADSTTLSLIDSERLNINYRRLKPTSKVPVVGFGGEQHCYVESGIILMRDDDDGTTCYFTLDLHIPVKGANSKQREQQRKIMSVVGRDLISQCDFRVHYQQGIIELVAPQAAKYPSATRRLL